MHVLFDDPECQKLSPKYFERLNRDKVNKVPDDHCCGNFSPDLLIPPKWRDNVINCRTCKRNLVSFLSQYFLHRVKSRLRVSHRFVTAGGFEEDLRNKAFSIESGSQAQCVDALYCNAEESDTRIWLHVLHSAGTKKLILSPDTDVYHIGLPIIANTDLDIIVRLSTFNSLEHRFLDIQALIRALRNDPDLAAIEPREIAPVIQMLYISTGCDFISFFNGLGKVTFLATFFEHAEFIASNSGNTPGSLIHTTSEGLLSFVRLVGCTYYKKHKAAFRPSFPTPMSLYNSVMSANDELHSTHTKWLNVIRDRIWSRVQYEEDMIPSYDALRRHWMRSSWVASVWYQATTNNIQYPPVENFGWTLTDNCLTIDWDSDTNLSQVRDRVAFIKKGCGCRTGCLTARCKCKKAAHHCGPGCKCTGCTNVPTAASSHNDM